MASISDQVVALITAGQPVPQSLAQALQAEQAGNVAAYFGGGIQVGNALDTWLGGPAQPTAQPVGAVFPALLGGILAALRALVAQFGAKQILVALLSFLGIGLFKEVVDESGQGRLEMGLATLLPGVQPWLGEFPAGLGQIEGRLVQKWTAGGAKVYFAEFEQPTRTGAKLQFYVFSSKRQAWLPYSYRRNIVIGGKELALASALGFRKHVGKKKLLQLVAKRKS